MTEMHIENIPYGKGELTLRIPGENYIGTISPAYHPGARDETGEVIRALRNPIGTPTLKEIVATKRGKRTVIVVNDPTRPTATQKLLPPLLSELKACGVLDRDVLILIATGTHRAVRPDEFEKLLGEGIAEHYRIVNHDCLDIENMVNLGMTSQGIPIVLNRLFCEADIRILTGSIHPHQGAGFSGGRKSILPGLTSLETLKLHHGPKFRPAKPAMGWLDENPFHLQAMEGARRAKPDLILNLVQNQRREVICAVAGDLEEAWMAGVKACREVSEIDVPKDVDIVVAVPGGHPRDFNLYQSQKSIAAAELVVRKGGSVILPVECPDGVGSKLFFEWMASATCPEEVMERFRVEGYDVGTSKAWLYSRCLLKAEVIVVSDCLDEKTLAQMFTKKALNLNTAVEMALETQGPRAKILVLRNAADIIPTRKKSRF